MRKLTHVWKYYTKPQLKIHLVLKVSKVPLASQSGGGAGRPGNYLLQQQLAGVGFLRFLRACGLGGFGNVSLIHDLFGSCFRSRNN